MPNTLFGRLLLGSLLLLGLFFGVLGYIIDQIFYDNIVSTKQEQLRLQNYILLSSAQFGEGGIELPDELREGRFDTYESGLYGYITDEKGKILWTSYSAHSLNIDNALLNAQKPEPGKTEFQIGPHYYSYHYSVLWEFIEDKPQLLTFTVLEDNMPIKKKIAAFQQQLQLWFAIIGFTLIFILLLVLRWGTHPLRQLAVKLKQVENGEKSRLEGEYPRELMGITNNLNELLAAEQRQRKRYHATLSDLAHSLKTPLAVIQAELESNNYDLPLITEQIQHMDEIIKHQLQRAVVTTPYKLGETVNVKEGTERLTSALAKVYASKNISFMLNISDNAQFKGDQRDLIEILGNLLDNACKACVNTVKIDSNNNNNELVINIHDDGEGIPIHLRKQLIKRGLRADNRDSGQGIGLDVAWDIMESYQGHLVIEDSPLGGALFQIKFPD
ncbi:MAG: ATP-binding protein [Pseudomonadales bacterium]